MPLIVNITILKSGRITTKTVTIVRYVPVVPFGLERVSPNFPHQILEHKQQTIANL